MKARSARRKIQGPGKRKLAGDRPHPEPAELSPVTLQFRDQGLEAAYQRDYFLHNLANVRLAYVGAAGLWVLWGIVLQQFLLPSDRSFDLFLRYGVFIPLVVVGFVLTFIPFFRRHWEWVVSAVVILTMLTWIFYVSEVRNMPVEYGYVGLILIGAFTYTLLRLRFILVMLFMVVAAATYLPYATFARHIFVVQTVLAYLFVLTFGALGGMAAYRLELSRRVLFLRERQLEQERERSDGLLLNILPQAIVDRLKAQTDGGRIAEDLDEVSVLFADAVDSTEHAAKSTPEEFAETLDKLFRRFDEIADRYGLEKIKTIGDAYMAAAGAPVPVKDHAAKAADAALDMLVESCEVRWPTGDPVVVRVGLATGPAVAGVIGQRKFAYDLWGDTVNLASRLAETGGEPDRIQVTEPVVELLKGGYEFSEPRMVDLKGKGPTPVRFLVARRSAAAHPNRPA